MHHKRSVGRIVDLDNGVLGEYRGDHTSTGTDLFELDQHEVLTLRSSTDSGSKLCAAAQ
jgi:hypothetical protein